jgi:hypothetical protein
MSPIDMLRSIWWYTDLNLLLVLCLCTNIQMKMMSKVENEDIGAVVDQIIPNVFVAAICATLLA